jgi:RNA polymerase sigma factor (sigma-70 family)
MKSFTGTVSMYNESIYVDTNTGTGVDLVLKKIEPLIFKMSSKTFMRGYAQEDIRQELNIMAIEGIKSFDKSKNVKLSTFLHIHLRNKLISQIKSENKIANNATLASEFKFPDKCTCGSTTFFADVKPSSEARRCTECDKLFVKKLRNAKQEVPFCVMDEKINGDDEGPAKFSDIISGENSMLRSSRSEIGELEIIKSIRSLEPDLDESTAKMLYLISIHDYNISDAAAEVGLSAWEANSNLKKLSKNKKIKDMLLK